MIAQQARLGDITEASLNDSISRFKRFVNDFKQENKINYDLDESKSTEKRKGSVLSVIAQQARLGNITEASLNDSISRFKRSVNDFKQENKINYDLDESKSTEKRKGSVLSVIAQQARLGNITEASLDKPSQCTHGHNCFRIFSLQ